VSRLFATLDLEFFNYLKEKAELVSCNKGQLICKQGDPADAFYLIRSGLVRVAQGMAGGEMVRTYLKRGEFFGEIGLLRDQARSATCSALDAVDLVKIRKDDFELMLTKFPVVRETLEQITAARVAADRERRLPAGLQLDEFLNQGLFEAQNLLLIDLDNCTRCDACVNACADAHDGVTRLIRDGLRYDRFLVATACRSCRDPLCMTQCPVGSIRRKESLEIIIEDWCIGCGKCAELCPYGNINMHSFQVTKDMPVIEKKPPAAAKPAGAAVATPPAKSAAAPAAGASPAKPPAAAGAPSPPAAAASTSTPTAQALAVDPTGAQDKPVPVKSTLGPTEKSSAPVEVPLPAGKSPPATAPAAAPAAAAAKAPPSAAAAKPGDKGGAPAAKPPAPAAPKKMERKKVTVSKATTCDLCTQLSVPSCVYACPHDAAKRVDPTEFLSRQIGRRTGFAERFPWLPRRDKRTTH
jgi:Fe-S-cluster-containing hydrogenase component 2